MNGYGYLIHSAKGSTWKNHKYIRKEGKRYIYDLKNKIKDAYGSDEKEEYEKAEKQYMIDAAKYESIKNNLQEAKNDLRGEKWYRSAETKEEMDKAIAMMEKRNKEVEKLEKQRKQAGQKLLKSEAKMKEAKQKYNKTLSGKLNKFRE